MRFFKRNSNDERARASRTFVDGNIVYDDAGEVIFDPNIEAAAIRETQGDAVETVFEDAELSNISNYDASQSLETHDETDPTPGFDDMDATDMQPAERDAPLTEKDYMPKLVSPTPQNDRYDEDFNIALDDRTPFVDVTTDDSPEPVEPDLLHRRVNLGEIRMDVARITSDIQSGERLYQRAQQRVESLMGFVERAEVDFSLLNRLEPENRRLKARNRVLEAENESTAHAERRLRNELDEALSQLEEARADNDTHQAKLRALSAHLSKREDELKAMTQDMEEAALRMERTQTSVEVESRENVLLREQIAELSTRMDDVSTERMELAKIVESLKIDCDDFRAQKVQAQSEVTDLRVALATAQKVNGEMKTRMVGLHDEIKGFKTQYEFNVISRDDRIGNLEARLAAMTKQVRIKEDVAKSSLRDVAELRKSRSTQDIERERLERIIDNQQRQLEEAQSQIRRSNASMAELDQRYNDVAQALTVQQKRLTPVGEATPLSDPPPFEKRASDSPMRAAKVEDESLTPENVEDLITDYKLGLRDRIA